jgi:asparagine synthase (glutamine-hydrolysing)
VCGIFAAFAVEGGLSEAQTLAATRRLSHRGPDGEGLWVGNRGQAALGHRRLAVIGPHNGAQPLVNEDGTIRAVVNGEFYGYEAIRRDLSRRGHRFQTDSDNEILLHLYEDSGDDCLDQLRGEFAFALWDGRRQRLFAARDRFGIKPLVYAERPGRLVLASEAKALFAAGIRPEWDAEAFFHAASRQYVSPDRTLFRGIRQVPPGYTLQASTKGVAIGRYWDLDFPIDGNTSGSVVRTCESPRDETDWIERCRAGVFEAVRARMRSDVPVCFHLSGGLDSSTVVGIATSNSAGPVDAFTIAFEAGAYDESAIAADTARNRNVNLHTVRVTQADLLEKLDDAVGASEGLAINGHLPAKFLLHRAIHERGFRVVLTGEGADETFAGYAHLRLDLCRSMGDSTHEFAIRKSNQSSLGMMLPVGESLSTDQLRRRLGFVPAFLDAKATLGWRIRSLMNDETLAPFADRDAYAELLDLPGASDQLPGRHPLLQSTWLWSKTALANYILKTLGDGTEMPSSVEGRVPFLDHRLFELMRDAPLDLKVRGSTEKFILREAARDVLTDVVYRREKHPFDAPPLSLFAMSDRIERLSDRLQSRSFSRQPFFSVEKTGELLRRLPNMSADERQAWDPAMMMVMSTDAIQKMMDVQQPGEPL